MAALISLTNVASRPYFFKNAKNKSIGSGMNVVVLCSLTAQACPIGALRAQDTCHDGDAVRPRPRAVTIGDTVGGMESLLGCVVLDG